MKTRQLFQLIRDNARGDGKPAAIRADVASDTEARIYIYDVIDAWWGASASGLITALQAAGDRTVHLHINSPGGDVFEARAMASAVVAHTGTVITHIDGLAASAATYLALAASEVRMTEGAMFMVHNSWTLAWGNKTELRDTAGLLEKVDATIAADYARKTGRTTDEVVAWMDAETWFTSAEAKDAGFVDAIDPTTKGSSTDAKALASAWNLSAYGNAPKDLQASAQQREQLQAAIAQQQQRNANRLRLLTA